MTPSLSLSLSFAHCRVPSSTITALPNSPTRLSPTELFLIRTLAGGLAALGGCALCVLLAGLWRRRRLQPAEAPKMIALARQNAKHPGVAEWDLLLHEMLFQKLQTADLLVRVLAHETVGVVS